MGAGSSFPRDCSRKRPQALLSNYHSPVMLKALPAEPESESWGLEMAQQCWAWGNTYEVGHVSMYPGWCAGMPTPAHCQLDEGSILCQQHHVFDCTTEITLSLWPAVIVAGRRLRPGGNICESRLLFMTRTLQSPRAIFKEKNKCGKHFLIRHVELGLVVNLVHIIKTRHT